MIDYLLILLFVVVIGGFVWFIICRTRAFERVVRTNGFHPATQCPPTINMLCQELFVSDADALYQGGAESVWGDDAWIVSVRTGSDDPSQQALIVPAPASMVARFAASKTIGIKKVSGLLRTIDRVDPTFKRANLVLLPDPLQPYLSSGDGLVLYGDTQRDLRDHVPESVFRELLSEPGLGGMAVHKGHIVVWTTSQANPVGLLRIARALSS